MIFWLKYIGNLLITGAILTALWTAIQWSYYMAFPWDYFINITNPYTFTSTDEPYVYDVAITRKVRDALPGSAIVELACEKEGHMFKVISYQQERTFTYDKTDTDLREFQETIPEVDADKCQMVYTVTIHLPLGVEKTRVYKTNWFPIINDN